MLEHPTPGAPNSDLNPLRIPGDTTGDRLATPLDLFLFSRFWKEIADDYNALSDETGDGKIDQKDLLYSVPH